MAHETQIFGAQLARYRIQIFGAQRAKHFYRTFRPCLFHLPPHLLIFATIQPPPTSQYLHSPLLPPAAAARRRPPLPAAGALVRDCKHTSECGHCWPQQLGGGGVGCSSNRLCLHHLTTDTEEQDSTTTITTTGVCVCVCDGRTRGECVSF